MKIVNASWNSTVAIKRYKKYTFTKVKWDLSNCSQFHNLLEIGSKFAGRYPYKSRQVEVCQQRPVLRLVYLKQENACSQMYMDSNCLKNLAAKFSSLETNCQTMTCRSQAVNLTWTSLSNHYLLASPAVPAVYLQELNQLLQWMESWGYQTAVPGS